MNLGLKIDLHNEVSEVRDEFLLFSTLGNIFQL